jgi:hypothetical protein
VLLLFPPRFGCSAFLDNASLGTAAAGNTNVRLRNIEIGVRANQRDSRQNAKPAFLFLIYVNGKTQSKCSVFLPARMKTESILSSTLVSHAKITKRA